MLCEIGGTVGDIESLPFLEAIRQLGNELGPRARAVRPSDPGALDSRRPASSRPSRPSIRSRSCRASASSPTSCSAAATGRSRRGAAQDRAVLQPPARGGDPGARRRHDLSGADRLSRPRASTREVCRHFGLDGAASPISRAGAASSSASASRRARSRSPSSANTRVLLDAYKSLAEALTHGGIANNVRVKLDWIDSEIFEREDAVRHLEDVHGILVPGGFGERGAEGKIAGRPLRARAQGALFRHLLRHADGGDRGGAQSRRHRRAPARPSSARAREPVVGLMTEWMRGNELERRNADERSRRHHAARRL